MFFENICNDNIITISDDVIVIDSSSDSIITISDTNCSVINISDDSNAECSYIVISDDDSAKSLSLASFNFETSMKMLLPQPRTSTPFTQRSAVDSESSVVDAERSADDAVTKARNRECNTNSFVFIIYVFLLFACKTFNMYLFFCMFQMHAFWIGLMLWIIQHFHSILTTTPHQWHRSNNCDPFLRWKFHHSPLSIGYRTRVNQAIHFVSLDATPKIAKFSWTHLIRHCHRQCSMPFQFRKHIIILLPMSLCHHTMCLMPFQSRRHVIIISWHQSTPL